MTKRASLSDKARARLDQKAAEVFPDPENPTQAQFDAMRKFMEDMEAKGGGDLETGLQKLIAEEAKPPEQEPTPPQPAKIRVVRKGNEVSVFDAETNELLGLGDLDAQGYLSLAIYTKAAKSTVRGGEVFNAILDKFIADGVAFKGVRGLWYEGDNLATFNDLIRQGLNPEEAAAQTFTGKMANRSGYTKVRIDYANSPRNADGTFQKAEVWFDQ